MVLRIADDPRIVGEAVGTTPIFNWLLWGYGIPAASFWAGSILLRRGGDDAPLRTVEAAAILFTVLLAFMEIRHAVNNGDVYRGSADLTEVALQVCVALAMAIGLERLRIRTGSVIHNAGAILLTAFAGLAAVFGLLLLENPMLWYIDVGGAIINLLLLGYALPAVLALLLSYAVAGRRPVGYANTIAAGSLILALAYVTFEIRRIYHGPVLVTVVRPPAPSNTPTRSRSWRSASYCSASAFSSTRSARGWRRRSSSALTILKAFLIDMSTLTGVYRALSFMCLGLVLVAIGWLYQRILFRRQAAAAPRCSGGRLIAQAARTESRNLPTSSLRRLLSLDSDCAAERTCDEADSGLGGAALHVGDVGGDHPACPARPAGRCGRFPASPRPALPRRPRSPRKSRTACRWCRRFPGWRRPNPGSRPGCR